VRRALSNFYTHRPLWQCRSLLASDREDLVLDLMMIATGLAFFALSIGYALACDRL
jgi:SNF family Na+-dependent transporter